MFSSVNYDTVATRMTVDSKTFKILAHISKNDGATKYDFVTKVLKKSGDKQQLRGYYSDWCQNMVKGGILTNKKGVYKITLLGKLRLVSAFSRSIVGV